ncbi:cystatin-9-like [Nycticebus coucang]|uniref:cystatin-9-like n=1 Tax=Nycticebus coucang TaxID=9470 RepID=UPI00234D210A|nr:cystatin-9-like [Nycticebus coucang]
MSCLPWTRALPWALLLLVSGFQVLPTQPWPFNTEESRNEQDPIDRYLPFTVEYALHIFNMQSKDSHAYRLLQVLDSRKDKWIESIAFSMNLLLGRTKCGKFEDDIDNCPFQERPELNNTFICFFTVSIQPWLTRFELLNKTCSEGFP